MIPDSQDRLALGYRHSKIALKIGGKMMRNEQGADLRQNVGARNPYEMVSFIERKKGIISETKFRKMLKEIKEQTDERKKDQLKNEIISKLEEHLEKEYSKLFDPKYCSPLYPILPNIWGQPDLVNPSKSSNCTPCTNADLAEPFFSSGNTSAQRNEACQGAYGDCYFVAALYSLIWANPYKIIKSYSSPYYSIYFLNISTGKVEEQKVTKDICLNVANGCGIKAYWAAIYEKAYSAWLTTLKDPINPPICELGNPITALTHLSWKIPSTDKIIYTTDIDPTTGQEYTGDGIYSYIKNRCCQTSDEKERAARPLVAYTYLSASVNPHNTDPSNPTYIYDNCAIPANHSFSILGVHLEGTKKYIILRNPYGPLNPVCPSDPTVQQPDPVDLFTGTWSYTEYQKYVNGVGQGNKSTISLSMSLQDGIFGLGCDYFKNHFEALGWVPI